MFFIFYLDIAFYNEILTWMVDFTFLYMHIRKRVPLPNMKNSLSYFFQSDPFFSLFRNEMFIFDEIVYWIVSKFAVFYNPKYIFFPIFILSNFGFVICSGLNLNFIKHKPLIFEECSMMIWLTYKLQSNNFLNYVS